MLDQLSGIDRTFNELTERLGDPDVLANPKLLMEVSQERSSVEEVRRCSLSGVRFFLLFLVIRTPS